MATRVYYCGGYPASAGGSPYGALQNEAASFALANGAANTVTIWDNYSNNYNGEDRIGDASPATTNVLRQHIKFNTTGVGAISSASMSGYGAASASIGISVASYNWGPTFSTSVWVPYSTLSGLTASGSATLTTEGNYSFGSGFSSSVNTTDWSYYVVYATSHASDSAATAAADVAGWALTVIDNSTQNSSVKSSADSSFTPSILGVHQVHLWAGGARSTASSSQEDGGGGGGFVFVEYDVTSYSAITISVAATQTTNAAAGNDSYFNSATTLLAKGGALGLYAPISDFYGDNRRLGGAAQYAQAGGGSRGGAGGAGSGSFATCGMQGTQKGGANSTGGRGGNAGQTDNSSGGAAGTYGVAGQDGTSGTYGGGGGGGGGSGAAGGSGGVPGGGSGGGGNGGDAGNGAAGKMVIYWYQSAAAGFAFSPIRDIKHLLVR